MADEVRDSYDAIATRYTALALGDLDRATPDRGWLEEFASVAALGEGVVADLGCGPGHVTNYLSSLGLSAHGYDFSASLIAEAQREFPDSNFQVGDLTALSIDNSSLAGIVARYSLIHMPPAELAGIFAGWPRVLEPHAPVLISFFAADTAEEHGTPFDHVVATAYQLFPETIVGELRDIGFEKFKVGTRGPLEGERRLDHGTILAVLRC